MVAAWLSDFTCELQLKMTDDPDLPLLSVCMQLGNNMLLVKGIHSSCSWILSFFLLRYTLGEWFNVSEQNGRILSLECARHMMALSDRCLDSYLKLSGRAIQNGHFLFPARPKIHVTWFIPKLS